MDDIVMANMYNIICNKMYNSSITVVEYQSIKSMQVECGVKCIKQ